MDTVSLQQILNKLDAMNATMEAFRLKQHVMDIRIDLMETRFDYRFDLIDEHLAFISEAGDL